jgi:pimeloyl-ACP methyl ester carboxylesterase
MVVVKSGEAVLLACRASLIKRMSFCQVDTVAKMDTLDRLHEIACPVLVMVGEQDLGTPPEMAHQIHANLPNSQLVLIKEAAHIANIEQPGVFNRALTEFMAQQN